MWIRPMKWIVVLSLIEFAFGKDKEDYEEYSPNSTELVAGLTSTNNQQTSKPVFRPIQELLAEERAAEERAAEERAAEERAAEERAAEERAAEERAAQKNSEPEPEPEPKSESSEYYDEIRDGKPYVWKNCEEAIIGDKPSDETGQYLIEVPFSNLEPINVTCESDPAGGHSWTRIQFHSHDVGIFNRDWYEYRKGFGNLAGDHFLGLSNIHALTHAEPQELWIQFKNLEDIQFSAFYDLFAVGDENQGFPLNALGNHSGTIGDAFRSSAGQKFSASDRDNDGQPRKHCSKLKLGGWWFYDCTSSNLNGNYIGTIDSGIIWNDGVNKIIVKKCKMSIRPRNAR